MVNSIVRCPKCGKETTKTSYEHRCGKGKKKAKKPAHRATLALVRAIHKLSEQIREQRIEIKALKIQQSALDDAIAVWMAGNDGRECGEDHEVPTRVWPDPPEDDVVLSRQVRTIHVGLV